VSVLKELAKTALVEKLNDVRFFSWVSCLVELRATDSRRKDAHPRTGPSRPVGSGHGGCAAQGGQVPTLLRDVLLIVCSTRRWTRCSGSSRDR
jgi:hypothetical protein